MFNFNMRILDYRPWFIPGLVLSRVYSCFSFGHMTLLRFIEKVVSRSLLISDQHSIVSTSYLESLAI